MLNFAKLIKAVVALAALGASLPAATQSSPEQIITASCSGCHASYGENSWFRVSDQRKTPEGWQMTLVRMQLVHKAVFVDPAGGDNKAALRTMIKYLADTQGLAPGESAPYRYILEQELNTVEQHDTEQFATMCARCHTGARVGLQRRTEDEWRLLVHFHLGQYPTTEYQMMGRDRDWLGIALNDMVPYLAENYPMQTDAWREWLAAPKPGFEARWRVVGSMPGRGDFSGVMVSRAKGGDQYAVEFSGQFDDGQSLTGSGTAIVYTGYEWRATLKIDGKSYRQVLAASANGAELGGRMFQRDRTEWGLRMRAVRDTERPKLLAVQPSYLQAGTEGLLRIVGVNLKGKVKLGRGLKVLETVTRDPDQILVRVAADRAVRIGAHTIRVGDSGLKDGITLFKRIDRLEIEPAFAVARVGGDGGSQPEVEAMFDAYAWTSGADGEAGSADDQRIGPVAAQWSVAPWDAQAVADEDLRFAGQMNTDDGVFTPAAAGPNPERKYQTNNAGNLKVIATLDQDGQTLQGDGHLVVTVQRWNNPPIR